MKKIGIVTWHNNPNYGGLLQAFALQEVIKKMGYEPEFINYRHDINSTKKKMIRVIKNIYMMIFKPKIYNGRRKKMKFAVNYLNISIPYYTYNDLKKSTNQTYSACICGSDQIWSNNNGINPFYYLDFFEESRRISYAPSIGYNYISDSLHEQFKEYILKINYLSIRERKGAEIIKSITGRDAKVVLDPSLLLDKKEWLDKTEYKKRKLSPKENYILLYILGDNEDHVNYAKKLSSYTGYKLIALETKYGKINDLEIVNGDPFDFIDLLSNASYILTDSFHGVAFSINFEKQFIVFKRFKDEEKKSQNSRIYNILDKLNLINRLINSDAPVSYMEENFIDYNRIIPLLDSERNHSLKFLKGSLENVIN